MIDRNIYNQMKKKYGKVASWAVWCDQLGKPKSNMGDMEWARDEKSLLPKLNPKFVLVGLNKSKRKKNKLQNDNDENDNAKTLWKNFHSGNSRGHSYKLRYALKGTKLWGAYMTDIIKVVPGKDSNKDAHAVETNSKEIIRVIKKDRPTLERNIKKFESEISLLGVKPVLIALGKDVRNLFEYLKGKYDILELPHYSYSKINKEQYRVKVFKTLKEYTRGAKK